jgi:hypothetical protein
MPPLLVFLAPFWILFDAGQLIVAERFLGVKQIEQGVDPRERGPGQLIAFIWISGILTYWAWMLSLLFLRAGMEQVFAMLTVSIAGYFVRRNCGLKWILVVLTFEGAIRIGMLISICSLLWRRDG